MNTLWLLLLLLAPEPGPVSQDTAVVIAAGDDLPIHPEGAALLKLATDVVRVSPERLLDLVSRPATRTAMLESVQLGAQAALPEGTLWVFFSGRATAAEDGELHLLGAGARPEKPQSVPLSELVRAADNTPAKRVVVILDARLGPLSPEAQEAVEHWPATHVPAMTAKTTVRMTGAGAAGITAAVTEILVAEGRGPPVADAPPTNAAPLPADLPREPNRESIEGAVRRFQVRFLRCMPPTNTRYLFILTLQPTGEVSKAEMMSDWGSPLAECMQKAFKSLRLSPFNGPAVRFEYSITFVNPP